MFLLKVRCFFSHECNYFPIFNHAKTVDFMICKNILYSGVSQVGSTARYDNFLHMKTTKFKNFENIKTFWYLSTSV